MKRPRPGDLAWVAILTYELLCPPGELLCESIDRRIARHPLATRLLIAYTALHVGNLLPARVDLYFQAAVAASRTRKRLARMLTP